MEILPSKVDTGASADIYNYGFFSGGTKLSPFA
jgi:hypothetical protein